MTKKRLERLKDRAAFCHFYKLTPSQVREFTILEYQAFTSYMREYTEARSKAGV